MGLQELQKKHIGLVAKGASANFVFSRCPGLLREVKDFIELLEEEKRKTKDYALKERAKMGIWLNYWQDKTKHLRI